MKTTGALLLLWLLLGLATATTISEEWETWKKVRYSHNYHVALLLNQTTLCILKSLPQYLLSTVSKMSTLQTCWKWKMYNKHYATPTEEAHRLSIWKENKAYVEHHNSHAHEHGFTLGMNKFADTEEGEMKQRLGFRERKIPEEEMNMHLVRSRPFKGPLPPSVDWRDHGAVLEVKDQKRCGSCWSFGVTGTIEGQNYLKNNLKVPLSEQNLMDCSRSYGNNGCNGGNARSSYKYIINNTGIDTEASYPYTASYGLCKYRSTFKGASITDYKFLPSGDEDALTAAIASVGPIAVSIDASNKTFHLYNGTGIYYEPSCKYFASDLDHLVLAVGYGSENGKDYYIVKNSWGASWGAEGYIKMARNRNNNCGIATRPSYPIM